MITSRWTHFNCFQEPESGVYVWVEPILEMQPTVWGQFNMRLKEYPEFAIKQESNMSPEYGHLMLVHYWILQNINITVKDDYVWMTKSHHVNK